MTKMGPQRTLYYVQCLQGSHPANGVTWDIYNVFLKLTVLIEIVSINIYLKYNKYKKKLNLLFSAEFKV